MTPPARDTPASRRYAGPVPQPAAAAPRPADVLRAVVVRGFGPSLALVALNLALGWAIMGPGRGWVWESGLNARLQAGRTATLDALAFLASTLGNVPFTIVTALLAAGIVWWAGRRWWVALAPPLALALEGWVHAVVSLVIGRERPQVEQLDAAQPTASFPSGHVGANVALWVVLAVLSRQHQARWLRWVVAAYGVLYTAVLSWSRLYLGMHHLSDVLVGLLNGVACGVLALAHLRPDRASRHDAPRRARMGTDAS